MPMTEGIKITSMCPIPGGKLVLATFDITAQDGTRFVNCDFGRFQQKAFVSCTIPNDTSVAPDVASAKYHIDTRTIHMYFPLEMHPHVLLTLIGTYTG